MPRFGLLKNEDKTGRVLTLAKLTPAYASSIAIIPNASKTYVFPADLTGALTLTAELTLPQDCDELVCVFKANGGSRIVTFSTGFAVIGTLTVPTGKVASVSFVFNGETFVETGRAIAI